MRTTVLGTTSSQVCICGRFSPPRSPEAGRAAGALKPPATVGRRSGCALSSSKDTTGSKFHWTDKLAGGDSKDELRYMDSAVLKELGGGEGQPWRVTGVLRDRDNATLVGDARLVGPFLAQELGCDEATALAQLERVLAVFPVLGEEKGRLAKMGVQRLAALCDDVPRLVRRLIFLKRLFPHVDVGRMAVGSPFLLSEDEAALEEGVDTLRELFPFAGEDGTAGVEGIAAAVPQLLDPHFARGAMQALDTLYGHDAARMVHSNPKLALQVESAALRSRYSASFDQTHVRGNKVVPLEQRDKEDYYNV